MEFSSEEKLALIRVLEKIAKADHEISQEEMEYFLKVASYLDLDANSVYRSKELNLGDAGHILAGMDDEKKMVIRTTLIEMAVADGAIDINELKVLMDTFLEIDVR